MAEAQHRLVDVAVALTVEVGGLKPRRDERDLAGVEEEATQKGHLRLGVTRL